MNKFIENLKHLPTTIAGGATIASLILLDPSVQAAAGLNPHATVIVAKGAAIAAGLKMIFGTGGTTSKP